ncbi:MAG: phage major capsid protein [Kiritimatiellia bacterium]
MAVTKEELAEIQKLVKEMRQRVEENQTKNDGLLSASIEKYNTEIDKLEEKADQAVREKQAQDAKVIDLQARLEALEKMPNRKGRFVVGEDDDEAKVKRAFDKKAYFAYVRQGKETPADLMKALIVADDSSAGYWVADDVRADLMEALKDESKVRGLPRVRIIQTTRDRIMVPSGSGAMTWAWVNETTMPGESSKTAGMIAINVHNAGGLIKASPNMLDDSAFNIEQYISDEFKSSLGLEEDDVFIGGTGNAQPEGVLTNLPAAQVTTTGAANRCSADDMFDFEYALEEKYAANSVLMCRRALCGHLRKLKAGDGHYLWQPSLQVGEPANFDGIPVVKVSSTKLSATVATGNTVAILGDWNYYWVVDRLEMSMQRVNELYLPLIGFYFRVRRGGKRMLDTAFRSLVIG